MAITYSLITPLIVLFAFIVICLGYIVCKYQLFYVFDVDIESGGLWWPMLFDSTCFALAMFQLSAFGVLVLIGAEDQTTYAHSSKIPNWFVIPLPLVTLAFWLYITFEIRPQSDYLSDDFENIEMETTTSSGELSRSVFNPAIVDHLLKVWLNPEQQQVLPHVYQPKYRNIVDFTQKCNPNCIRKIQKVEAERESKSQTISLVSSSGAALVRGQESKDILKYELHRGREPI